MLLIYFDIHTRCMVSLLILWPSQFTQTWPSRRLRPSSLKRVILKLPSLILSLWISQGTSLAPNKVTSHCPDWCQRYNIMIDSDLNGIIWLKRTGWRWLLNVTRWCQFSLSATAKWAYGTSPWRVMSADRWIHWHGKMRSFLEIWYLV